MSLDKMEIIYYELAKMEERMTEKVERVLQAEDKISKALQKFEILQKELIKKLDSK